MKIKVNPDKNVVTNIRAKLKENDGYCPCSLVKTEETKCPCKEFLEKGAVGSFCHCGLYFKEEG